VAAALAIVGALAAGPAIQARTLMLQDSAMQAGPTARQQARFAERASELIAAFAADLAAALPNARLVRPPLDPATGAALLARELSRSRRPCPGGLIEEG